MFFFLPPLYFSHFKKKKKKKKKAPVQNKCLFKIVTSPWKNPFPLRLLSRKVTCQLSASSPGPIWAMPQSI